MTAFRAFGPAWAGRFHKTGHCDAVGGRGPSALIVADGHLGFVERSRARPVAVSVGEAMGWRYTCRVRRQTGFVNPGGSGSSFGWRLAAHVAVNPEIILVVGGGRDLSFDHGYVRFAAESALKAVRKRLPDARIVFVGPIVMCPADPQRLTSLGKALTSAAEGADVEYVDAGDWFLDATERLVAADGVLPNERGAAMLTQRIVAGLKQQTVNA